ncbi:MAG: type II toxin-antitoxin system RelE/ParE family toxin [Micropruina sp.]|uniref:type II toxin-antitoxin system RelE/ParE family toxin n=1 Tax=Micropruina sp. TaxID=2737536 RepID=UPI0039E56664
MGRYRLSAAAQSDVAGILAWSQEQFGESARKRYQALLSAALRDVAAQPEGIGAIRRPELGDDFVTWHLRLSRNHVPSTVGTVQRPRHLLVYRHVESVVEVVRVLHDSMELSRHLEDGQRTD